MKKAARLLVLYLIAIVLLSSVDVTYEWLSPFRNGEESAPMEWYAMVGLRNGLFLFGRHEPPEVAGGWSLRVHEPKFFPIPFYAGAGRVGGGVILSAWFIGLVLWIIHSLWAWPAPALRPEYNSD